MVKIDFESIGDRLEAMRKVAGLNKQKTYELLETTKFIYHEVRYGRKKMPLSWAFTFNEKYGFNLQWIYSGQGEIFISNKDNK
ncbi:putative transcriptional regulator [Campylobacter pinnipediorum subsp. caledonicus]|uniref:Putative transcriptional regulator n=1 Tax=Campylobacter pinnipediorum subsp. caledonicus TaxID=1874362 RepID=A0A1S6U5X3_9BACT|nr:hypothetical protein [Campylobacter pinnipediorum]AQW87113.1 putative transcriptional regulator [Campylobacter pinnipediorum subsp. caledonicus]